MPIAVTPKGYIAVIALVLSLALSACGPSDETREAESDVAIAYIKRPVSDVSDPSGVTHFSNPTDSARSALGGDLFLRERSSPRAIEYDLTGAITLGAGDVSDPEVSYDGKKIIFAMRCGVASHSLCNSNNSWNIWEYDITDTGLTAGKLRQITNHLQYDDIDPAYLPDGRIVFSSNRQQKSREIMKNMGLEETSHLDESLREPASVLHAMNGDGSGIEQISFNQSHDRNPTVLGTGEIIYSRWDHSGRRNQYSIYKIKPDGTDMDILYGAHTDSSLVFLHPREMQSGQILSTIMPLDGTRESGAIVAIDVQNFSDNGQYQPTLQQVPLGLGVASQGRFTAPYPLWDGTNRALVSFTPPRTTQLLDLFTGAMQTVDAIPAFGLYLQAFDDKTTLPIVLPQLNTNAEPTTMVVDVVTLLAREKPAIQPRTPRDTILETKANGLGPVNAGVGILNIKSVYDTDGLGRMGDAVLVPSNEVIPKLAGTAVPDLNQLKQPGMPAYYSRPARFVRVTRAIPMPAGLSRAIIGESDFPMQQIVGYAPIEPDGSVQIEVPADVPLAIAVLDGQGRAFQNHTNWLQVRPGETVTCNGCHAPRRANALNRPIVYEPSNACITPPDPTSIACHPGGMVSESMAETKVREEIAINMNPVLPVTTRELSLDIDFADDWALRYPGNPAADTPISITYDSLNTAEPAIRDLMTNTMLALLPVNYLDHIQPLWEKSRVWPVSAGTFNTATRLLQAGSSYTCVECHNNNDPNDMVSVGLDLRATPSSMGRVVSYDELLIGELTTTGLPVIDNVDGELRVRRNSPLVNIGDVLGGSRASHLIEILYREELRASKNFSISSLNHGDMFNASEKRLVIEWIDLGAQYYNDPYLGDLDSDGAKEVTELRGYVPMCRDNFFDTRVHPVLVNRCAGCHKPIAKSSPSVAPTQAYSATRFVLTGDRKGDFNTARALVNDTVNPDNNPLLAWPASNGIAPNPAHPRVMGGIALPSNTQDYQTIRNWISSATACP